MSDNDATRRRQNVADPLRSFVTGSIVYDLVAGVEQFDEGAMREIVKGLDKVADEIDREHERRMEDCRRNTRRVTCNYISRVVADYKRGRKWQRKEYGGSE